MPSGYWIITDGVMPSNMYQIISVISVEGDPLIVMIIKYNCCASRQYNYASGPYNKTKKRELSDKIKKKRKYIFQNVSFLKGINLLPVLS